MRLAEITRSRTLRIKAQKNDDDARVKILVVNENSQPLKSEIESEENVKFLRIFESNAHESNIRFSKKINMMMIQT